MVRKNASIDMVVVGTKVARNLVVENLRRPMAIAKNDLPRSVAAITREWLTDVLCGGHPGAQVIDFALAGGSSGTHERRRLLIMYNEEGARAGLPASVFTKSLPTLVTRMLVGFMGHSRYEMLFYQQVRPHLTIETPECYFSKSDKTSLAALHMLEDVVYTKGAQFLDERTVVDKTMAEDIVDLLVDLHSTFYNDSRLDTDFSWLVDFPTWIERGVERVHTDRYSRQALAKAASVIPDRLLARRGEIWPKTMRALDVHRQEPSTVIHSDVHIGNWYRTSDGAMGLLDWQVLNRGHWSRDLSYAIVTSLTIEDRREWESHLVRRYLESFNRRTGSDISYDKAWRWYRQQMLHALHMWTQTLCHPRLQPNSQRDEMTYELIRRITTAIDDLDALDA